MITTDNPFPTSQIQETTRVCIDPQQQELKYDLSHVTREETIETLERLIATGQIDRNDGAKEA